MRYGDYCYHHLYCFVVSLFGDYSHIYHLLLVRTDIFGDDGDGGDYHNNDVNHRHRHRQYRNGHEDVVAVAVVDFDLDVSVFFVFSLADDRQN